MRFTLEIETGNDAMQSPRDLARALITLGHHLRKTLPAGQVRSLEGGRIHDLNGNTVGRWAIDND